MPPRKNDTPIATYILLRRGPSEGTPCIDLWMAGIDHVHKHIETLRECGLPVTQLKLQDDRPWGWKGKDGVWGWRMDNDIFGGTAAAIRALRNHQPRQQGTLL